jgi:hypothetical protein
MSRESIDKAIDDTLEEMYSGNSRWGGFHSFQEGYAVVEESLQQLRNEMILNPRSKWNGSRIAARALKLTAMSLKLLLYLTSGVDVTKRVNPLE